MQTPMQITWRNIRRSDAIEADVRDNVAKLEQFCDQIISCRVVVEAPHKHHHKGNLFRLRIDLKVPDKEIVVTRDPSKHQAHEDMYVVIHDAFEALRRQLQDYVRVRRGHVKCHDVVHTATVLRLLPEEGYGFLRTPDGDEVYFHRNSLVGGDFDRLEEGTPVSCVIEQGNEGLQARRVTLGKHDPGTL